MWLWRKYRSQAAGLLVMAMLFCSVLPSGARANDTLPARLIEEQIIGEGAVLQTYIKKVSGKDVMITVTKVDLNNPYAEVRPIYGKAGTFAEKQTITEMAKESGAIAAINSDFFTLKNRTPFGITLDKGELVSSMGRLPYWVSLGITNDRTAIIERFTYQGKVTAPNGSTYVIQGVNKEEYQSAGYASHRDQVNLYTPAFGPRSLGLLAGYENYVEVVVENQVVKEVRIKQPAATIPREGYVLWGHGSGGKFLQESFKVGDSVQVSSSTLTSTTGLVLDSAMAGHILLVDNGTALAPSVSSIRGTVARSAAGITQDGKTLLLVAVESSSRSRGMELTELAQLMKELGSYRAFNLDGGGSTTMAARKLADTEITLLNQPQGGTQRKVPTGIGIFNTAPKGDFKGFLIEGPTQVLKGSEAEFRVRGYDVHYHPFAVPQQDVLWTGLDSFTGNKILGMSPGVQDIKAEYQGFSQTRKLEVIGASKVSQILVEPAVLTVNKGQARTFSVKVQTNDGKVVDATPRGVDTALSTDGLGTVNGFTFTAGQVEGRGELVVNFDGIEKRIPVNVGTTPQAFESFDALTGISYSALPSTIAANGSFTLVEDPVYRTKKAARLNYSFAGAAQTEIRFAYGLLGSKPLTMPGTPLSAGLWVYGDNCKHWLRSELVDAKGTTHYLDWTKEIDFSGWKYLMASIPSAVIYPVSIKSVYVVNTPEGTAQRPESGTLYFDELTLYQPYDPSKDTKPSSVVAQQGVRLAGEVEIKLDGAAHVEPVSTIPLQMEGYKPALQGFRLSGEGQHPQTVALSALNGSNVGLLYLDAEKNAWVEVKGTRLASGESLFPIQGWGLYIPYYSQAAVNPFKDVKSGSWYEKAVVELYQQGIVNGISRDQFGPNAVLTRAQFVTLLGNWLGWKDDPALKLDFKDSIPAYAVPAVKIAVSKGIVQGFPGGLFKPDAPLTRAQMSVMLYNALQDKGADLSGGEGVTFTDRAAIPGWASEAVQAMARKGYIKGMNGSFKPQDTATRAQAASLIYQLTK